MKFKLILLFAVLVLSAKCFGADDFPLDLSKVVNMGFADEVAGDGKGGWSDQGPGNDMRGFAFGRKKFEDIQFNIINPAKNGGKAVMTFDSRHARTGLKVAHVPAPASAPSGRFLYLLHTSCWNQEELGAPIGTVEVLFEDGSGIEKVIKAGVDLTDWWGACSCKNAAVVYKKMNRSTEVGVFFSKLSLGKKDQKLKSVTFKTKGNVVWIVLAATLSTRDIPLKEESIKFEAGDEWKVVDMSDIQVQKGSALDLSDIADDGPAGSHGRVIIGKDGCLAFEDNPSRPVRLQGFNGLFSTRREFNKLKGEDLKKHVTLFAELTKRQGYSIIRPLVMDSFLMEGTTVDCEPNPEKFAVMDQLIYELKKRGIYTYITIAAYRMGFSDKNRGYAWNMRNDLKALMYLGDEKLRRHWKEMANKILKHVNPYTGVAWKDEPAIACVEFYNEQEIGLMRLHKLSPEAAAGFNRLWQEWLKNKYKTVGDLCEAWKDDNIVKPGSFEKVPPVNKRNWNGIGKLSDDMRAFMSELDRKHIQWYEDIVRQAGYKGLVSQYNLGKQVSLSAVRWESSPLISMNNYFCHPSAFSRPGSRCGQKSSVGSMAQYWCSTNSTRLSGRPIFVTEHNHAFWNQYQHEDGLLFGAYSALQNFSAVMIHEDSVAWKLTEKNIDFSVARSPVMRASEFVSCCLFRRGDVQSAKHFVELQVPKVSVLESNNGVRAVSTQQAKVGLLTGFSVSFPDSQKHPMVPDFTRKPDMAMMLGSGAELISGEWATNIAAARDSKFSLAEFVGRMKAKNLLPADNLTDPDNLVFQSDTGEITLRAMEKLMKVVTPKTEGVSLKAGKSEPLKQLAVVNTSTHATIAACAMDGRTLADSTRIVLVYSTEIANSGMELSEDRVTLRKLGDLPVLMRCGKLEATLKTSAAGKMSLYALGINGERKEKLPLAVEGGALKISIDTASLKGGPTPFFELVVEK